MADLDPAHVEAVARMFDDSPLCPHQAQAVVDGRQIAPCGEHDAETLLTSTDPAVHAALLAALVRAGVLEEERESATLRMFGGKVVMRKGTSRFVTEWAEEGQ